MESWAVWFLLIAAIIIVASVILTRLFRQSSLRDSEREDLNADARDGSGIATWAGIHESDDTDLR